jgi:hypothetical protein
MCGGTGVDPHKSKPDFLLVFNERSEFLENTFESLPAIQSLGLVYFWIFGRRLLIKGMRNG